MRTLQSRNLSKEGVIKEYKEVEAEDICIAGNRINDTIDVLAVIYVSLAVARSSPQSRGAVIKCDIRVNYTDRLL